MITYPRSSTDYRINLVSLHEMEEVVPMTTLERQLIRDWAKNGHDIESNPWNYYEPDFSEMNYLKARRIKFGTSHGPWDRWEYDTPIIWSNSTRQFDIP